MLLVNHLLRECICITWISWEGAFAPLLGQFDFFKINIITDLVIFFYLKIRWCTLNIYTIVIYIFCIVSLILIFHINFENIKYQSINIKKINLKILRMESEDPI